MMREEKEGRARHGKYGLQLQKARGSRTCCPARLSSTLSSRGYKAGGIIKAEHTGTKPQSFRRHIHHDC